MDQVEGLEEPYARSLCAYLRRPDEQALQEAFDLGRQAFERGCSVGEVASLHTRTLVTALDGLGAGEPRQQAAAAGEAFLRGVVAPFELTYQGVREANASLGRLNEMLEAQARQIAYALHDGVTQVLAASHMRLADLASQTPESVHPAIAEVRGLLDQIEDRVRGLARDLRPTILDDLGLVPALRFLADSASKRWGLSINVAAFLDRRLPVMVETVLYRVTQEALTNVGRHACASQAQVWVSEKDGKVCCAVRDDGIGFDAAAVAGNGLRGLGLAGMEERVAQLDGTIHIAADQGRGTEIVVEIPVERIDARAGVAGR